MQRSQIRPHVCSLPRSATWAFSYLAAAMALALAVLVLTRTPRPAIK